MRNNLPTNTDYLRRLATRQKIRSIIDERTFDRQRAFILDPSKNKILFTPRRSGKSYACGLYLIQEALLYPGRTSLYLGLTKESANRAVAAVIAGELNRIKLRFGFNKVDKTFTLRNGSQIKLSGLDSSQRDQERLLGGCYHLCIIDECQSHIQDLESIIYDKLGPAMGDFSLKGGGIFVLAGTPGEIPSEKKFWYRLTRQDETPRVGGWSMHSWNASDNPHYAREFAAYCAKLLDARGPGYRDEPGFRREYLGEWQQIINHSVYRFEAQRDQIRSSPRPDDTAEEQESVSRARSLLAGERTWVDRKGRRHNWTYCIGVDLGWVDATAFVVTAYSSTDNILYIVESSKAPNMTLNEVAGRLISLNAKFRPIRILLDQAGAGKQMAESIRREHGLPIFPADKTEKHSHVARMNSDFVSGRIRVIRETNAGLACEWQTLALDHRALERGEWKEAEKFDNHLADAALYAYKDALHALSGEAVQPIDQDSYQAHDQVRRRRILTRRTLDPYEQLQSESDARIQCSNIFTKEPNPYEF